MCIRAVLCHGMGLVCLEAVKEFCRFQKQKSDHSSSVEACLLYKLLRPDCHLMQVLLLSAHDEIHVGSASHKSRVHQSVLFWHHKIPTPIIFCCISNPLQRQLERLLKCVVASSACSFQNGTGDIALVYGYMQTA